MSTRLDILLVKVVLRECNTKVQMGVESFAVSTLTKVFVYRNKPMRKKVSLTDTFALIAGIKKAKSSTTHR